MKERKKGRVRQRETARERYERGREMRELEGERSGEKEMKSRE